MPSRISPALFCLTFLLQAAPILRAASGPPLLLVGTEGSAWQKILAPSGLRAEESVEMPAATLREKVSAGAFAILQGHSAHAAAFGILAGAKFVPTRQIRDARLPALPVIWQKSLDLPEATIPAGARIFAKEHWTGTPVLAGIRHGRGAVLWLAAPPGEQGYERFPYLVHALADLGVPVPLSSNRLWAFLDTSYRMRVDIEYLAKQWERLGLSALHIAAWHYNEPDDARDAWLRQLIAAAHRRGILVYAWIELPHVSERFWQDHPEWREKTGLLQDAHLDWRKLMNLRNRDCFRAVETATRALIGRFDWDGVNFGELYYESLEGIANPARFTPMNSDVRAEYKSLTGTDPLDLMKPGAAPEAVKEFLQYRAESARRMQSEWMGFAETVRKTKPWLDLVLTHVDDRFDTRMRDLIGADAERVLPLQKQIDFTFLVEDPATVWHLGPDRYRQIAERYKPLTPRPDRLAIDINVVERYQDVYPTKQQTGTELLQLVHVAARSFRRVALYFESSLLRADHALLPAAASGVTRCEPGSAATVVESPHGAGLRWDGDVSVDGKPWPVRASDGTVWLPPGAHAVSAGRAYPGIRIERLNAELRSAAVLAGGMQFAYESNGRGTAILDRVPAIIEIDGEAVKPDWFADKVLILPRGQHVVTLR